MPPSGSTPTARSGRLALIAWTSGCEPMTEEAPFGAGGFATTRVFVGARERVWREWTQPDRFADWFGGVDCEIPLSSVSMDVRPGGSWRAPMFCGPDRRRIDWSGEYHGVVPSRRLGFTIAYPPRGARHELV